MERADSSYLNSRQAYINLTLATLAFAIAFAAWSLISPIANALKTQLHLDDFQRGLLIAVPVILGSLARIPLGLLTDRLGGRKVFTGLLLFTLLPVAFLGIADGYWQYILGGLFLGMAGASFAVGVPFVNRWFTPDKQGFALGVYGVGNIGTAIAAFSMPALKDSVTLRGAFWFYLIPVAVMAVIFWLFARDAPGLVKPKSLSDSVDILRREPLAWLFSLFYFLTFGGFVALGNYLPSLLQDWFKGMSPAEAGLKAAGFTVLATVARPLGGWLSDQVGGSTVLGWVFAAVPVGGLLLAWLAVAPAEVLAALLFLAVALGLGLGNGAVFKLVSLYFPKNTGLVTGVVGCAGGLGGFFPPLVMGYVKGSFGNYVVGFVLLAVVAVLCFLLLWRLRGSTAAAKPGTA